MRLLWGLKCLGHPGSLWFLQLVHGWALLWTPCLELSPSKLCALFRLLILSILPMLINTALISSNSSVFSWLFTWLLTVVDLDLPLMIKILLKLLWVFIFNEFQTLSMLASASVTIYALSGAAPVASTATVLFLQPWFLVLVAASAVERLTGLASGVAFERDWVVLVSFSYLHIFSS